MRVAIETAIRRVAKILYQWAWFLAPWLAVLLLIGLFARVTVNMPGESYSGPLRPLSEPEWALGHRLEKHVQALAGIIGERNLRRPGTLEAAARYIQSVFTEYGYTVSMQEYRVDGERVQNVIAILSGVEKKDQIIVVGAHYDSAQGSPGANDNATGVAAVLEIARLLAGGNRLARTVHFLAFVNEEPPYFQSEQMGSRIYARRARRQGEKIVAMLSLETIGYYDDELNSQSYPFLLGIFYPSRGNFIGFVANPSSKELLFKCISSFRSQAAFPSEGVAAASWITGVDWSDQWSFWEEGYPAVMVTDTALFRYPHYHSRQDTPDKIVYDRMARVVSGLHRVIQNLAE